VLIQYMLMFFVSINYIIILCMIVMLICCGNTCNAHFSSHFFIPDSPTVSIMNMRPLDVVENVTLKLVCQVLEANPTVNAFSWYKGSSTTPIGMISNFSISKVIRTDSGEYRCEVSVRMVLIQYMLMFFVSINYIIILCVIVMVIFSSNTCNADLLTKHMVYLFSQYPL
jgi:hypothetical protein